MKSCKRVLPDYKDIEIHALADLHIGDRMADLGVIKSRIEYIAKTENAFAILNGDILNTALKTSVSDVYGEIMSPMQQLKYAVDLFQPIKDKIIAITSGNHEDRVRRNDSIDLMELLAREYKVPYGSEGILIFLQFGCDARHSHHHRPITYTMYCTHGTGGGRKEGAKAIRLADLATICDADVYIHSHTHLPMIFKQGYFRPDIQRCAAYHVTRLFVNTSATLHYGGYGQAQEYKPSSMDTPVIHLSGTSKRADATL